MQDVKVRPKVDKLRAREYNAPPKEAVALAKRKLAQQQQAQKPKDKEAVEYATNKVESAMKHTAAMPAVALKAYRKKQKANPHRTAKPPLYGDRQTQQNSPKQPSQQDTLRQKFIVQKKQVQSHKKLLCLREETAHSRRQLAESSVPIRHRPVRRRARDQSRAGSVFRRVVQAITEIAKAIGRTIVSGGKAAAALIVSLCMLMLICFVGLFNSTASSPYGILFAGERTGPDTVPIATAAAQILYEYSESLQALGEGYDGLIIEGETAPWAEILAVFAVKTAGRNDAEATDVVTMDADRVAMLKIIFENMNPYTTLLQYVQHPDSNLEDVDDSWTERILHVIITPESAAQMADEYHFTDMQTSALEDLLNMRELLDDLVGSLSVIDETAQGLLQNLPEGLSADRVAVVNTALSLVGKVSYFWGGKSLTVGWDARWGTLQTVTAPGSPSTGTNRPFGLDCSGFVDWVFYNAMDGAVVLSGGRGAMGQHNACRSISWVDAQPGDLVFYPGDEHVGIVVGSNSSGQLQVVSCASGANGVVIASASGYTSIGRPVCFTE